MNPNIIRKHTRNARRLEEILRTLAKYGFADFFGESLPESIGKTLKGGRGEQLMALSQEERIRLALTDLGTTFIKIGQILSTRSDLIGGALAEELSHLQADTPPDPPEVVQATIEAELGLPVKKLYAEFNHTALASASIGQVHAARLPTGEAVVVKVQHSGVEERVTNDFDIIERLAGLAERHNRELRIFRPQAFVAQFRRDLLRELDFTREVRSLERFIRNFKQDESVVFPRPHPDLSTRRVLTMDFIEGTSIKHTQSLVGQGLDTDALGHRGARIFMKMVFEHGFYHGDPHPGNIFVLEDDRICLLDCGMTGRLDDRLRENIEDIVAAAVKQDAELLADAVLRFGGVSPELDRQAFEADINEFVAEYGDQTLESWDFSALINDLTGIIRRHRIYLPADVSMLLRMLVVLEGSVRLLSPTFSLGKELKPYIDRSVLRRLSPQNIWRRLERSYRDWDRLLERLPRELQELVVRFREGTLDIHLQHHGLNATVNRLVYGLLTGALILGATTLWAREIPPLLGGLSLPGTGCAVLALVLGVRLLRSIENVGGLGKKK